MIRTDSAERRKRTERAFKQDERQFWGLDQRERDLITRARNHSSGSSLVTLPPELAQDLNMTIRPIVPASSKDYPITIADESDPDDPPVVVVTGSSGSQGSQQLDDVDLNRAINDPLNIQLDPLASQPPPANPDLDEISHIFPDISSTDSTIAESSTSAPSTINIEDLQDISMASAASPRPQPQQEGEETPGRRRGGART